MITDGAPPPPSLMLLRIYSAHLGFARATWFFRGKRFLIQGFFMLEKHIYKSYRDNTLQLGNIFAIRCRAPERSSKDAWLPEISIKRLK